MKRLTLSILTCLMSVSMAMAIPAKPGTSRITQPDGSSVDLCLHGDEYWHYTTTADGYSVVKDERGYWVYAALRDDELIPTTHVAHSVDARQSNELEYLKGISRNIAPKMSEDNRQRRNNERAIEAQARQKRRAANYDYTKLRGLIILVEFNDQSFSRSDYKAVMEDMVNKENYTGYLTTDGRKVEFTGSVHDYFRDNSLGLFTPQFDIVGPVQVARSKYYPGSSNTATEQLIRDAIDAADSEVNFADYDGDADGEADMIYFIFAGCGSHINGNDSRLLWPHASFVLSRYYTTIRKDNIRLGRYACSTEMTNSEKNPSLDGIGTICHEFSHVLGLPDFYDTDYTESGGESDHPGDFSILASGSYLNEGKTPCGYTLFERYVMGFTTPTTITDEGEFTLEKLSQTGTGYRINTPSSKEYFLFENRQREKWDMYIPGHGMVVFRVDSSNVKVWNDNLVNVNPNHMYFEILRAGNRTEFTPFPGMTYKTELTQATNPSLKTWAGLKTQLGLRNIAEEDGIITFDVFDTYKLVSLTLPTNFKVGLGLDRQLVATGSPSTAEYSLTWATDNAQVATVDVSGKVYGVGVGTCNITVTSNNGVTTTTAVTVEEMTSAENIAAFRQLPAGQEAMLQLKDAQVLYVQSKELYLRDASGAMLIYNSGLTVNAGDILNGCVYGKRDANNEMPDLAGIKGSTLQSDFVVTGNSTPEPRSVNLYDLTEADYGDYVRVKAVRLVKDGYVYAVCGDNRARMWNAFNIKTISVPSSFEDKFFDVDAIYGTNSVKNIGILKELKLMASPVEVEAPAGIVSVSSYPDKTVNQTFNLSGQRVDESYRGLIIQGGRKVIKR